MVSCADELTVSGGRWERSGTRTSSEKAKRWCGGGWTGVRTAAGRGAKHSARMEEEERRTRPTTRALD